MKQVNLYEAKTGLSGLVEEAAGGEDIVIAKNGKPRAVLVSVERAPKPERGIREFGFWADEDYRLPDDFGEPDPEIEAMFYGDDESAA